ncbi:MAG: substrate-binding domain-containing protein [Sandaracinaceae bacterium]|nr:substrate-binding domain-containing protein [Sandaracinaceae bacterium]
MLHVVADGILPLRPLVRAIARLKQAGVPTRVGLRVEYLEGVRERFDEREADLMLSLAFAGDARHVAEPLAPIEMVLLAGRGHALAKAAKVERAALAQHVELVVEDSSRRREAHTSPLALGCAQVFRLSDFHSKREALLEGAGVGWMPRHLVVDALREKRLALVPFGGGEPPRLRAAPGPPPQPPARSRGEAARGARARRAERRRAAPSWRRVEGA